MPHIGSGRDGLEWISVLPMIKYIFLNTNIEITTIHSKSELSTDEKQQIIMEHHINPLEDHRDLNQTVNE